MRGDIWRQSMSLLDSIASRFGFERRAGGFGDLPGIALTGHPVNSRTAENLSAVLACVSAVSTAIASLPAYVYREGEAGRDIDRSHPLNRLFVRGGRTPGRLGRISSNGWWLRPCCAATALPRSSPIRAVPWSNCARSHGIGYRCNCFRPGVSPMM
jgi:hypothetical protein